MEPEEFFAGGFSLTTNSALVHHLLHNGVIKSVRVAIVMERIDRDWFVPKHSPSYIDRCLPIGFEAAISAPYQHAMCLELLKDHLKPGMHALDVGSGSGYMTACFANMVESHGCAVGVEKIPELVKISVQNIRNSKAGPLLRQGSLSVNIGDGMKGWWAFAPYNAIHVGFFAPEILPPLIDQLKPGGRLVVPIADDASPIMRVVDKKSDGTISERIENLFHLDAMMQ